MDLLVYAGKNQAAGRLLQAINAVEPDGMTEIYRSFERFSERLLQPVANVAVAVIVVGSRKEFYHLLEIGDLIRDVPIILILPDQKPDTLSKGHSLYPRYVSYVDSDFSDVAAVLNKIRERFRKDEKKQ